MNKNKFRFRNPRTKEFITTYYYCNSLVDGFFEPKVDIVPQQFLGIYDKNMKEVYEGDVVKGSYGLEGLEIIGDVRYSCDLCAYVVDYNYEISNIAFDTLEVVGHIDDYTWNEAGELVARVKE